MRSLIITRLVVLVGLLMLLAQLSAPHLSYADDQPMCFTQTQQCILEPELRDYWQQNGGLSVFGYPITQAHGRANYQGITIITQWFERNRLEVHPENSAPYNVLLGLLGAEVLRQNGRDLATLPKADPAAAHYFAATGHAIADAFWGYWSRHGLAQVEAVITERESVALFGYPISEAQMEQASNGQQYLTQWFERARFEYHPENPDPNKVLLGLLGTEMQPSSPQRALAEANRYRAYAGVPPLQLHNAMIASAQNHANYYMLNYQDQSAMIFGPHGEVAGHPGFTGKWPTDRVKAAGFPWYGGAEVMHFIGDPTDAVDDWISTIYHRAILLDPNAQYTGYGYGSHYDVSSKQQIAVDVMDFAQGPPSQKPPATPYPLAYPANGQGDVLTYWGGGEAPDPLPPGASRPVGFPFTLQGINGDLRVDGAEMRDGNGQVVSVYPSPSDCKSFGCYALIAVSPLHPNTTYKVHAHGTVGNVPFDRTWQFTTGNYQLPKM
jgi:uncharacterized protein YkwD